MHGLATELARRHEVAIFCGEDDPAHPPEADETWEGLRLRRICVGPAAGAGLYQRAVARFHNPKAEQAFERFLATFRPDVVHVHHLFKLSGGLIAIARRHGVRVVVTLHDYWFICDNAQLLYGSRVPCRGPRGGLHCAFCMSVEAGSSWQRHLAILGVPLYLQRTRYLRQALSTADRVIAPSRYVRDRLRSAGIPLEHCQVLYSGTADGWLSDRPRAGRHDLLRLGYLGTIAPHKGVDLLLRAFLRLPAGRAELHIHGDAHACPDYLKQLQEMAGGAAVRFHGAYDRSSLAQVLANLDLVVVPSIWPENAPATIQEALMAGVPVLAADTGGLPEFVAHEESGLLFRAGDVDALEAALRRPLGEPELIARWARAINPPKTMRQYVSEVERIYEETCLLPAAVL